MLVDSVVVGVDWWAVDRGAVGGERGVTGCWCVGQWAVGRWGGGIVVTRVEWWAVGVGNCIVV